MYSRRLSFFVTSGLWTEAPSLSELIDRGIEKVGELVNKNAVEGISGTKPWTAEAPKTAQRAARENFISNLK